MKIVSYNIHYAIGKDDCYDLSRIVDSVQSADIIALQEVERFYGPPDGPSQPEAIAELLPDFYWVYDAAFDIDGSERLADGTIRNRRRQHGQMTLSRYPILSKRYYPLPRTWIEHEFNMQMGVLEAVVATDEGPLRIYNAHFGSVSSAEREQQATFLCQLIANAPLMGGSWTGPASDDVDRDWSAGVEQPPMPASAVALGDFNMQAGSAEYEILTGYKSTDSSPLLTDIWQKLNAGEHVLTWHSNASRAGDQQSSTLDYCFLSADLLESCLSCRVDTIAAGSDHQPLWIDLDRLPGL